MRLLLEMRYKVLIYNKFRYTLCSSKNQEHILQKSVYAPLYVGIIEIEIGIGIGIERE